MRFYTFKARAATLNTRDRVLGADDRVSRVIALHQFHDERAVLVTFLRDGTTTTIEWLPWEQELTLAVPV